jgi:hypothetical protein
MALTYEESFTLMQDPTFRGRVKVAVLKFADSIMGEAPTVPAHNTRLRWASGAFQNPDAVAAQTAQPVVMDSAVQAAGATVTDVALQGSVEAVVNKMMN